jgi:DNA/RNA-binding domain of Phe-tRNA-synthetase-like protein
MCEAWARVGLRYPFNEYRACWRLGGQPLGQRLQDKPPRRDAEGIGSLVPQLLAWNWRQCARTWITGDTRSAVFVLDVLDPLTDDDGHAAADALTEGLLALSPGAAVHRRLLAARPS